MCLSAPKVPRTPPPPAPPPPEPELAAAENSDPDKDAIRRGAEGTQQLRIDRATIFTGDPAGLQVSRRKPRAGGGGAASVV